MRRLLTFVLVAAAAPAFADDCAFRADRSLDLDAAGLAMLSLATGAGDLHVEGVPGLARVELRGKACASSQALLDQIKFDAKRDGNTQQAMTSLPDTSNNGGGWFGGGEYAWMDVAVRVPAKLALEARDSSGDAEFEHVASLKLQDSSGDINVRDVTGDVSIEDSSGDIVVEDVVGSVLVPHDSSGDIRIANVRGNAEVKSDSSGDINFRHIEGNARVGDDSSGSIVFRDVGHDAAVDDDSSGDIDADDIGGSFTVGRKSGGDRNIHHSGVKGTVKLPGRD